MKKQTQAQTVDLLKRALGLLLIATPHGTALRYQKQQQMAVNGAWGQQMVQQKTNALEADHVT